MPADVKLGVIMLPTLFGPSTSFDEHVADLSRILGRRGHVATVPLYPHSERPPNFASYVQLPGADGRRQQLAAKVLQSEAGTVGRIKGAAARLRNGHGCTDIALIGFAEGGRAAIRGAAALNADTPGAVNRVAAWYPPLVDSDLQLLIHPALIFYGTAAPEVARISTRGNFGIGLRVYPGVRDGFADSHIQGVFPNRITHDPEAAHDSWFHTTHWLYTLVSPTP
jgi:dienelactone hydrolase